MKLLSISPRIDRQKALRKERRRPVIAFFDYPDVFEDFYPHYGVTQTDFATMWHNTANHAWLAIIQKDIGDVIWYSTVIRPEIEEGLHRFNRCRVKFVPSSWVHRQLWKLFYLPSFSWRWRRFYRSYALVSSYLAPLSWNLLKKLMEDRPDVLYIQDYCSGRYDVLLLFARILKIPCLTFHSGSTSGNFLGKRVKSLTLPKADWIFPSGTNEQRMLTEKYHVPRSRQTIIRPPIDTSIYKPLDRFEACLQTNLDPNKRYFIFIGRFEDQVKRLSSIIQVFAELCHDDPRFEFLIVGKGADEEALKSQANLSAPGKVHFLGWIGGDEEKALILNAADCLLLASWREASPAVIGEAFACGVPVISSDVGGIGDLVIKGKTGWLFPAGSDSDLKSCMEEVMKNPEKVAAMRHAAREIALDKVSIEAVSRDLRAGFSSFVRVP